MAGPKVSMEIFALSCCNRTERTLTRPCVYMLVLSNNLVSWAVSRRDWQRLTSIGIALYTTCCNICIEIVHPQTRLRNSPISGLEDSEAGNPVEGPHCSV